ncbi:MAG: hypothetical protein IJ735_00880 [Clostridia bacterium]|nr:hypothetical protein [Clostridia bacterium]
MARVINLDLNFDALLHYADKHIETDVCAALSDLNAAAEYVETSSQRAELYRQYIRVYKKTSNNRALLDAVGKEIEASEAGEEFFRLDFGERKDVRAEFEDETVGYEDLKNIAKIRCLMEERRYEEAFSLLQETECSGEYARPVVDAIASALDADETFTLNRYVEHMVGLMMTYPDQAAMISLMLRGGPASHSIMIESAEFFLGDEDPNALCLYGMAYFKGGEPSIAEKFFQKTLGVDPIDEDALYNLAVIKKLQKKEEEAKKLWLRYRETYKSGNIPLKAYERYFSKESDDVLIPFLTMPSDMMEEYTKALFLEDLSKIPLTDDYCEKLYEMSMVAPIPAVLTVMRLLDVPKGRDNLTECYKKMLAASRVPQNIKDKALDLLLYDGYEGRITYVDDKRAIVATLVNPHMRSGSPWLTVFRRALCHLFYSEEFIPIRCSTLIAVIRKCGTHFRIGRSADDVDFGLVATFVNYLHKIKSNVDYAAVVRDLGIDFGLIEESILHYGVDNLIVV